MAEDPKIAEARKQMAEILKLLATNKVDSGKLEAVIKEGKSLKGDKDNPD